MGNNDVETQAREEKLCKKSEEKCEDKVFVERENITGQLCLRKPPAEV